MLQLTLKKTCQDERVVFIILSDKLLEDKLGGLFKHIQESIITAVCHSVIPSFCHSVNLSGNFNLATNF